MSNETAVAKKSTYSPIQVAIVDSRKTFVKIFGEDAQKKFVRESGFAMMAISNNQKLSVCSPESFQKAVANVALTGLSLNPTLSLSYLTPRFNKKVVDGKEKKVWEAVLIPSYMGLIEILRNAGTLSSISAEVVYEGDEFEYERGTSPYIKHKPTLNKAEGAKPIAAYAVANLKDGTSQFELMDWTAIMKRKDKSDAKDSKYGPWINWEEEMAKKTVIRALYKLLPKSERATEIIRVMDEQSETIELERSTKNLLD